ncbi:hypothetical protein GCM10012275_01460 [Longimycelium tulufanense]|uniref:Uncharacterized protein n=1 Tax=Longimycelium tulufanense TaxID=907463 RepID=A0A8J3FTE7_9PSEU|nr:hypothetical protein [Longimycelium tulufanense]GGM33771.1 hypothetical protein GCM10012275_01460 [Longimycelium tulufanense]
MIARTLHGACQDGLVALVFTALDRLRDSPADSLRRSRELSASIHAWRGILRAHTPPPSARHCPKCRNWLLRPRRWPCRIWREAITSLGALNSIYAFSPPAPMPSPTTCPSTPAADTGIR